MKKLLIIVCIIILLYAKATQACTGSEIATTQEEKPVSGKGNSQEKRKRGFVKLSQNGGKARIISIRNIERVTMEKKGAYVQFYEGYHINISHEQYKELEKQLLEN